MSEYKPNPNDLFAWAGKGNDDDMVTLSVNAQIAATMSAETIAHQINCELAAALFVGEIDLLRNRYHDGLISRQEYFRNTWAMMDRLMTTYR